jgi:uroporphyrinogen decarboxylase
MSRRERTLTAISHRQPDLTPYAIEFTSTQLEQTCVGYGMDEKAFEAYLGNHCKKVSFNIGGRSEQAGFFTDEFGVVWDRTGADKDIGVPVTELVRPGDDSYTYPEPDLDAMSLAVDRAMTLRGDAVLFGKIGTTYFERAWSLTGFQNMLMYMAMDEGFVRGVLDRVLAYNLRIIDAAIDTGIDGFYFGDDYGQQSGLLMSPEMWRRFFKEGWAEMFASIKSRDKLVALHSCGNITELLPEFIDIGLDIYQTVQPEVYDLRKLKADFGDRLCFWGGVSTQRDLPFDKPETLRRKIDETKAVLGESGGYIAGPTHRLPPDIPFENVRTLVEALRIEGG